jgi:putative endonuclease
MARKATGTWGEDRAAAHLSGLGYQVLERNVRFAQGELDIIAEDGGTLVFVEVKAFESLPPGSDPAENVHRRKQRQIGRLASLYLTRYPREPRCRFDVVTVVRDPVEKLTHYPGAFIL